MANTLICNDADHPVPVSLDGSDINVDNINIDNSGVEDRLDDLLTAIAATQPRSDAGPSWTTSSGIAGVRFTSADQSAAAAVVTSAPTSGQKLVITDLIVSVDTAMRVDFSIESAPSTVIESVYLAANVPINLVTRSKRKLGTADKKLAVKTSTAGNICVNAFYYSEA